MKKSGLILLLVLVGLWFVKDAVAKFTVSQAVGAISGLPVQIQRFQVGVVNTVIQAGGIRVLNPKGFKDPVMLELPELRVDYELGPFFQGKTHLTELSITVKEFTVVRNEQGKLNLDQLKPIRQAKARKESPTPAKPEKPMKIRIDLLKLKIDRVVYKDYSNPASPQERIFEVGIHDQYPNVTDLNVVAGLVVSRALLNTTLANLLDLDLRALQKDLTSTLIKGAEGLKETTETVAGEALDTLKSILPIDQQ